MEFAVGGTFDEGPQAAVNAASIVKAVARRERVLVSAVMDRSVGTRLCDEIDESLCTRAATSEMVDRLGLLSQAT
jgi:hypothetical protein